MNGNCPGRSSEGTNKERMFQIKLFNYYRPTFKHKDNDTVQQSVLHAVYYSNSKFHSFFSTILVCKISVIMVITYVSSTRKVSLTYMKKQLKKGSCAVLCH